MAAVEPIELYHYQAAGGRIPYREWLDTVTDPAAYAAVQARTDRLKRGLFGDCEPVGEGVWELRIDTGPGSQKADIKRAKAHWKDYEKRTRTGSGPG